jgi:16S rRNA (cytidine1402-2'-O)-methyltransferase
VGTPIGNLEDITLRGLRTLASVSLIAAEDTRLTRRLLARHAIDTALVSFHEHTSPRARAALVARLADGDVALVTDAGTPGISDPGAALVAEAAAAGFTVVPVPGPSAVAAALSVAGFAAGEYHFLGFLPRRSSDRRARLTAAAEWPAPLVVFEAPRRVAGCLADLLAALGDRQLCVVREATKLHEEIWHGQLAEAIERWPAASARGEFTLVVAGYEPSAAPAWSDETVRSALVGLRADGLGARAAARQLAGPAGRPAREIYALWEHDA